jgi:hypothetical protein
VTAASCCTGADGSPLLLLSVTCGLQGRPFPRRFNVARVPFPRRFDGARVLFPDVLTVPISRQFSVLFARGSSFSTPPPVSLSLSPLSLCVCVCLSLSPHPHHPTSLPTKRERKGKKTPSQPYAPPSHAYMYGGWSNRQSDLKIHLTGRHCVQVARSREGG